MGEKLRPLWVNLRGVVAEREFFQRDNYNTAATVRHSLVALMEDMYRASPSLRGGLREIVSGDSTVDVVLEGATLSLGRCIDLIRPAGLHQSSVSKNDYIKALRSVDHCMSQIRAYCDPDYPMADWGTMVRDEYIGEDLDPSEPSLEDEPSSSSLEEAEEFDSLIEAAPPA